MTKSGMRKRAMVYCQNRMAETLSRQRHLQHHGAIDNRRLRFLIRAMQRVVNHRSPAGGVLQDLLSIESF